MTETPDLPNIVLKRSWKANGHKGKLVADDTGIAILSVSTVRTKTKGFWSKSTHNRVESRAYVVRWPEVSNIDIT